VIVPGFVRQQICSIAEPSGILQPHKWEYKSWWVQWVTFMNILYHIIFPLWEDICGKDKKYVEKIEILEDLNSVLAFHKSWLF
jgi:hypothetical protein